MNLVDFAIGFAVGVVLGTSFGSLIFACLIMGKRSDEDPHCGVDARVVPHWNPDTYRGGLDDYRGPL